MRIYASLVAISLSSDITIRIKQPTRDYKRNGLFLISYSALLRVEIARFTSPARGGVLVSVALLTLRIPKGIILIDNFLSTDGGYPLRKPNGARTFLPNSLGAGVTTFYLSFVQLNYFQRPVILLRAFLIALFANLSAPLFFSRGK